MHRDRLAGLRDELIVGLVAKLDAVFRELDELGSDREAAIELFRAAEGVLDDYRSVHLYLAPRGVRDRA